MPPENQKNSIVFLGTQMEVAGAQQVLLSLATWFHDHNYAVRVVFLYDKQGLHEKWQSAHKFPIISLNAWGGNFTNPLRLLRSIVHLFWLLRYKPDALIAFTPHSNLIGLPVAWLVGVRVRVGTHHGYIQGSTRLLARLHGWLTNSFLCSMMVAVSSELRQYAINVEGVKPNKIVVIENGVKPILNVSNLDQITRTRKELGTTKDGLVFLSVGRLTTEKGHAILLKAIAQLEDRGHVFAIAGEGPLALELAELTRSLAIEDRVRFLGLRNDVVGLLQASDVYVQPSLSEGLPLSLLEAMFAGLPIIATDVGATANALATGGLLVPAGDSAALAAALSRFADAKLRAELGTIAKQRADKQYTLDRMCQSYERLLLEQLRK